MVSMGITFTGPSGSGKSTLSRTLASLWGFHLVRSCTTREIRPEETGNEYDFISRKEFMRRVRCGYMLEYAAPYGWGGDLYGTPLQPVLNLLEAGKHILFDVNVQGSFAIRQHRALTSMICQKQLMFQSVFIKTSRFETLAQRIMSRGGMSEAKRIKRVDTARAELEFEPFFDFTVINDDLRVAERQIHNFVDWHLSRLAKQLAA